MSLFKGHKTEKTVKEVKFGSHRSESYRHTNPLVPVHKGEHDWNDALTAAKELLIKDPHNTENLLIMGDCLIGSANYKLLFNFYNRLMQNKVVSSASIIELLNKLGEAYCNQNKSNEAGELFHKILKLTPNNSTVLSNLGFVYFKQNESEKALEYFQKALELDPNNEDAIFNLDLIKTRC
ncbi:MAG: tetratricopeptide repeat protein [Candidatus Scalindua sp.]